MLWWRSVAAVVAVLALVVGGCGWGGDDGKDEVADPVAEALAYVPRDAALVMVGKTDFARGQGRALRNLLERFPGSELVVGQVKEHFEKGGVEFDRDIAPLLGNDIVLVVPSAAPADDRHPMTAVAVAPDEVKLDRVVSAAVKRGALRSATPRRYRGATLYTGRRGAFAVDGPVVVAGHDVRAVRAALDLRARRSGLTPGVLRARLGGLPEGALVRVIGDARPLLAHAARKADAAPAGTAKAVKLERAAKFAALPWFASIRRFAATVTATAGGLQLRFRAATDGTVRDSEIPLATGPQAPAPVGDAPLVVGVRDLAHVIRFAQRVAEAIAPGEFRPFSTAKTVIEGTRGIDLDEDVFAQFTGTTTVRSDLRRVSVRAQVRDPKAMATTLDRLLPLMPSFLHGLGIRGASVSKGSGGRFVVERNGEQIAAYALDGDALVVTTDRTEEIGGPGSQRPSPRVPKGPGALVARLDSAGLQNLVIRVLRLPPAARFALGALGDATLTVRTERDRVEGRAELEIRQ